MREAMPLKSVEIATYSSEHFRGVHALWKKVFPDDPPWNAAELAIPAKLSVQPDLLIIALSDEQVIGSIMAGYDGHRGWLYALAVSPLQRRNGVATALVREAEKRLAKLGCGKVNFQVRSSNAGVVDFYKKLGYEVEDRISMGRRLTK